MKVRTDGKRPRREGKTACVMPTSVVHLGNTSTRSPDAIAASTTIVGNCTTPTPATAAYSNCAISSVTSRGLCEMRTLA